METALADPSWQCPPCRNICNCSICRRRGGVEPTGKKYRQSKAEGFKSVREFLDSVGKSEIDHE